MSESTIPLSNLNPDDFQFLPQAGEIAGLIRKKDWSQTGLGPVGRWPQSLRTTLGILLSAKFPMLLFWGPHYVCFYNDAFRSGFDKESIPSYSLGERSQAALPQLWSLMQPFIEEVLAGGEATWGENQFLPISGNSNTEPMYWTYSCSPVPDERGTPAGVLVTCLEKTEQVKARKKLEESEKSLKNLFQQAPAAIAVIEGPEQRYTVANPFYQKLFNRSQKQLIGKTIREVFPETAEQNIAELFEGIYRSGQAYTASEFPAHFERSVAGERELGYFNFVAQPMLDLQGEVYAIMIHAFEVTAQVVARQTIEESEGKYRNLFETMDQGFCIVEMIFDVDDRPVDYRFLEVNPVFERQTGLKEPSGKTARELVPNLETHWFEMYGKVALTGQATRFSQGSEAMGRWFEVYAFRLGDSLSRKVAILFTEITARRLTEQALQASNERFRLINRATQDTIWDWNLESNEVLWNEAIHTVFGYGVDEVEPTAAWWYAHVHPEDRERVVGGIHQVIDRGGESWADEYRYQCADGSYKTVFDRGFILHDEEGRSIRMLGSMQDITEKKRAEADLKESAEHFKTFADSIQNLAWMANRDGWIYWYNQQWYAYTGTTQAQMEGWGWQSVHDPAVLPEVMERWRGSIATGKSFHMVFPLKGANGEFRSFLTLIVPVFDEKGQIIRWIGTNTDIEDQKKAQASLVEREKQAQTLAEELAATNEELRAANEEIQASNEELAATNGQLLRINSDLDNFVYTASHDLKAPITNIESLLTALLRTLPANILSSERTERITSLMQESVERFKKTIANLAEVVKLQKEYNSEATKVNLSEVIGEVMLDLEPLIGEAKAQIHIAVESCPFIHFSEKNLRSVIYNLLSNAIKYRAVERLLHVYISCESTAQFHVLSITDNGLGMESERMDQLFTMFKRFHDHVEGTGIGLYMVKKMVENAGGKIEVESNLNKGSSFRVYFPL